MVRVVKQSEKQQQRRPLFDALENHLHKEKTSFHVPGHKNGVNWPVDSLMKKALLMDQTEVSGLDYLHEAEGVLKESLALLSAYYGSKQSYYLVNGSTGGNLAMITGTINRGDAVLVDRTSHQSVMHALELTEAMPIFLQPHYNTKKRDAIDLRMEDIQQALESQEKVKAVILTYPSYNGQVAELKEIIAYCRQKEVLVLVDEAHGPHFTLGSPFPPSALDLGADVVVHSAHKMLPAMTQSGYLHIGKQLSPRLHQKIERQLHILQSSSPSYILMHSLEYARYFLAQFTAADLEQTLDYREQWVEIFTQQGLHYWQSDDPLKGRLCWKGHSGSELAEVLESQGLYPEKNDAESVLLAFPLLKKDTSAANTFPEFHLPNRKSGQDKLDWSEQALINVATISVLQMDYAEQKRREVEKIPLEKALGEIAAQNITPYPPGIPLVLKGQKITAAHLESIATNLDGGWRIVGVDENREVLIFER